MAWFISLCFFCFIWHHLASLMQINSSMSLPGTRTFVTEWSKFSGFIQPGRLEQLGDGWNFLSSQVLFKLIYMAAITQSCQRVKKKESRILKSQMASSLHSIGQSISQGQPWFHRRGHRTISCWEKWYLTCKALFVAVFVDIYHITYHPFFSLIVEL